MNQTDCAPLLTLDGLTLERGSRILFQALSLTLRPRQTIWLKGENGSGKSSLLKACAGFLTPDRGHISFGATITDQSVAYLGHHDAHKADLTLYETLDFWNDVYRYTDPHTDGLEHNPDKCIENALTRVGLWQDRNKKCKTLSAGQSKRLSLARLTLSRARVWLLDEPGSALDQNGRDILHTILQTHIDTGGGALIATHDEAVKIGFSQILTLKPALTNSEEQTPNKMQAQNKIMAKT